MSKADKFGINIKHKSFPNAKFESGTIDRYTQKSFFFNISFWLTPKDDNLIKDMARFFKSVRLDVINQKNNNWFKDNMICFETTPVHYFIDKPCFVTFEFTFYKKVDYTLDKIELIEYFNGLAENIYHTHFDNNESFVINGHNPNIKKKLYYEL